MVKIKFIKEVEILSCKFSVVWNKDNDAGSFSWQNNNITVGINSYRKDPLYTFNILSHEIMEIILVGMGGRFQNNRTMDCFLFSFDHQLFENAIQIHAQVLSKFIKWSK